MIFVLFYANKLRILFTMFTTMAPKGIELWIMIICHVWQVMVDGRYGSYKFHSDNKKKSILCSQMNCNWTGGSASREPRDISQILPHACFLFLFFSWANAFLGWYAGQTVFVRFPADFPSISHWTESPAGARLLVHREREPRPPSYGRPPTGSPWQRTPSTVFSPNWRRIRATYQTFGQNQSLL
jgi:hypothetical protein